MNNLIKRDPWHSDSTQDKQHRPSNKLGFKSTGRRGIIITKHRRKKIKTEDKKV